jgi:glyoxylase-like metal-dependent hydrolase (beta-lactamase superfamily II)
MRIATIVSAPFDENTYILSLEQQKACLIVDPGLEPDRIVQYCDREGLEPAAILCTHGHSDHIGGNRYLIERWGCPLVIGRGDAPKLTDARLNLSAAFGLPITSPPADTTVAEGDTYRAAGIELTVRETPGHSAGHVVFLVKPTAPLHVLAGDVLFQGSVGRTDFPDGDFAALEASIHQKLFTLPDDTVILPGHGPPTTIGHEKESNPFVGRPAGYRR